jgi:asparagine synthase (glutamine-hydrolysing)
MSGIAAVIDWTGETVDPELIDLLLDRIPHRSTDGRAAVSGQHWAMGYACHATTLREQSAVQPLWDRRRGLCVVADVRLDNRDEIRELLHLGSDSPSDPELLLLGYERWGTDLARRLVGDFAIVLWDENQRQLYAARDPFGVRPLFFFASPRQLALASEVEQLLVLPEVSRDLEESVILDFLRGIYRDHRRTFFRDISRLAPGHYLLARGGSLWETRYWYPPESAVRLSDPEEYREEFRRLFRLAVTSRLDSHKPIVARLSGGLDSSSIVCMADDIYRGDSKGRPPLRTASAVYPGLNCDETPFLDALGKTVQFPSERYDGTNWNLARTGRFHVAHPWREELAGIFSGWREMAVQRGARVVLCGVGGDELLDEGGVFRDLAARGRWLTLLRQSYPGYCGVPRSYWLKYAALGVLPRSLWPLYRRLRAARPSPPPEWVGPRLRSIWHEAPPSPPLQGPWISHAGQYNWSYLASAHLGWIITDLEGYWSERRGLQLRYPFLDVRLARFVLAIPYQHRLPDGLMKQFLRRAMGELLPVEVAQRRRETTFEEPVHCHIRSNIPRYVEVLTDGRWVSGEYVDRRGAQAALDQLTASSSDPSAHHSWRLLWDILMLETWLRALPEWRANPGSTDVRSTAQTTRTAGTPVQSFAAQSTAPS